MAYNIEGRLRLKDLLGDREQPLSLEAQKLWKKKITEAMSAFEDNRQEIQRKLDASENNRITTNSIVLIKHTRRNLRRKSTFYKNLYKVVSRKNRKAVVKPLFGPPQLRSTLYDVYVGHLVLFSQSELLQHLPEKLQQALGANVPLTPQFELPNQLWDFEDTERGKMEAAFEKEMRKYTKESKQKVKTDTATSSSESDDSDQSIRYGDLPKLKRGRLHVTPPQAEFPTLPEGDSDGEHLREEFDEEQTDYQGEPEVGDPLDSEPKKKRGKAKRFTKWAKKYWSKKRNKKHK